MSEVAALTALKAPKHVAVIMDGNRRWAEKEGLHPAAGHIEGVKALMRAVEAAAELGIEMLTVYAFSTENWRRTQEEVASLLHLFRESLEFYTREMVEKGVKLCTIGDLSKFPCDLLDELDRAKRATAGGETIDLILALNYGGRDDICRAAGKAIRAGEQELSEETFSKYLDTSKWPDPELIIRTSGEMRLSNFLLWQASYSEMMVIDTLWPDFGKEALVDAINQYQKRDIRIGV